MIEKDSKYHLLLWCLLLPAMSETAQAQVQTRPKNREVIQTIEVRMKLNQIARQSNTARQVELKTFPQEQSGNQTPEYTALDSLMWIELATAENILLTVAFSNPESIPENHALYINDGSANPALAKPFHCNSATFMMHTSGKSCETLNIPPGYLKAWISLPKNNKTEITIMYH
jgi:hypothetical protein